ncbi:MAG: TonB-dependent receptor [Bryobacterales bacterium]|nr:TonB-dependent receptor [Bryobacterales bacterium]
MHFRALSLVPLLLCSTSLVFAQDTRARVQGLVSDSSGAVISGAIVTLRNDNTGVQDVQPSRESGQYLFDLVLPGTYTVTVELQGFKQFVQRNVLVQARGDVTVNATLEVGSTRDTVTVESAPVAVQFNTSTMALTLDTKMTNSLPIIHRNPFLLVSLNPATVIRSSTEQSPFHHWAASQFDVGGNTNTKNDIVLDGSASMTTQKSSYTPPMDAVQEVNVQQNAVDAEFGHSAGGVLSVQMKSGTNSFHGTGYYLGRNPVFNALADRTARAENLTRQHVWGGTLGNPIKKNRIFNFFSYEGWRTIEPRSLFQTLPTDLERNGDFSKSLNTQGAQRTIYDPWSTVIDGANVTRQPFAGNVIPGSRIDPTGKIIMGDMYKPNNPGTGFTGVNNFITGYANRFKYWNLSDRVDWNISDATKVFGRFNMFRTFTAADDYTGGSPTQQVDGSKRHAMSFSGDLVHTLSPSTVINLRGAYNAIVDSFGMPSRVLQPSDYQKFWGSNKWYSPYLVETPDLYYPGIAVTQAGSTTQLGRTGYWYQEPNSWNLESKMSKSAGRHYIKIGSGFRRENVQAARPRLMDFRALPALTANTFNSPNVNLSGDGWATLLLGALEQTSSFASVPIQRPRNNYTDVFVHDDIRITQRLTLNLGLRWEYFSALRDPSYRMSRYLDLTAPIQQLQGVQLPAEARALRGSNPIYNGAWLFTDSNNPWSWQAPRNLFMPRIGAAWRLNDKTAIRAGFARYIVPATLVDGLNILGSVPYPGFDAQTNALPLLEGKPQQSLSDPFPGGLVPVTGKSYGAFTNLGGSAIWFQQNFTPGVNDRYNISVQRQLPFRILADITYFMNIGRSQAYNYDLNQVDPRVLYAAGNASNVAVNNPFFNLLPATQMPGQLRTQRTIAVRELLRPYPQYNSLTEALIGGRGNRYKALQMQFQRPFSNGFNFVLGYNYNRESNEEFYDEVDNYTRTLTWQPGNNNSSRQRFTGAAIYELPFGKGRKYFSDMHKVLDGMFGGWSTSGLFTFQTGNYLRFGSALVSGDPMAVDRSNAQWFNTSAFKVLPAFTRRANPWQYDSLVGPRTHQVDLTLAKEFPIVPERLRFELRMEAYNLLNSMRWNNPDLSVTSATFGRVFQQRPGFYGRQLQYSLRLIW